MPKPIEQKAGPSVHTTLGLVILALAGSLGVGFLLTRLFNRAIRQMLGDWSSPFWLSIRVTTVATLIGTLAGIAVGYFLAKGRFPGRDLIESIGSVPIILPPTVLGYYLLRFFSTTNAGHGVQFLLHSRVLAHTTGLVLVGAIMAFPYCLRASRSAIAAVDPRLEQAGRAMGLAEWRVALLVTLPAARRGILVGLTLGAARAWGEYGATVMVGANIPGKTQTMALAVGDENLIVTDPGKLHWLLAMTIIVALAATIALVRLEQERR